MSEGHRDGSPPPMVWGRADKLIQMAEQMPRILRLLESMEKRLANLEGVVLGTSGAAVGGASAGGGSGSAAAVPGGAQGSNGSMY